MDRCVPGDAPGAVLFWQETWTESHKLAERMGGIAYRGAHGRDHRLFVLALRACVESGPRSGQRGLQQMARHVLWRARRDHYHVARRRFAYWFNGPRFPRRASRMVGTAGRLADAVRAGLVPHVSDRGVLSLGPGTFVSVGDAAARQSPGNLHQRGAVGTI